MQNHRRLHRQWCDERRMWVAKWNEVVFTDESRICLQHHDGRFQIWRHRGDAEQLRYAPPHWSCTGYYANMWSMVAQRLTQIIPPAATPDQLWQRVEAAWSAVPPEHIQSLFELMPRRVTAVISNNGGHSGY
ncbi:transposable element Tcb1 transposase [Trichonephila clavipes]|nr:transposable element Tcb1 transposase [Trichonephila clavipes]